MDCRRYGREGDVEEPFLERAILPSLSNHLID